MLQDSQICPDLAAPADLPISASPLSEALDMESVLGIRELWNETLGDPSICIAVLDGPVDVAHPSLAGANLTILETIASGNAVCITFTATARSRCSRVARYTTPIAPSDSRSRI